MVAQQDAKSQIDKEIRERDNSRRQIETKLILKQR